MEVDRGEGRLVEVDLQLPSKMLQADRCKGGSEESAVKRNQP